MRTFTVPRRRAAASRQKTSAHWSQRLDQQTSFFVGWGTLSLINAGLAQAKGRSGLLWWLLSLLLGPIATFLIVVLPRHTIDYRL